MGLGQVTVNEKKKAPWDQRRHSVTPAALAAKVLPLFPELTAERLELLYAISNDQLLNVLLKYGRIRFPGAYVLTLTRAVFHTPKKSLFNKKMKERNVRYRVSFRALDSWRARYNAYEADYAAGKVKNISHLDASIANRESWMVKKNQEERRSAKVAREIAATLQRAAKSRRKKE